jgi:glyoxylase-like metal-dependent hydrolase (beta-lactamase superfamily II)
MLNRRNILASVAAAATASTLPLLPATTPAFAKGAPSKAPGVARFKVGDIVVTPILDGYLDLDLKLFPATSAQDGRAVLGQSPQANPLRTFVNSFVIDTADKRVLIDTGGVAAAFPTMGRFSANLKAAGIEPASIDAIIMTHLHIDHVGGLFGANGTATFPNAELILAEEEFKFWGNPGLLGNAPAEFKPLVEAAQAALKPYAQRTTAVKGEKEVIKGLTLTPAHGHTPGHSMIRVASAGKQLLIWGDIVHAPALQFARPDWTIAFDADANAAKATRTRVMDMVTADKLPVMGAHLPFPGHGYVTKAGNGYAYEAVWFDAAA